MRNSLISVALLQAVCKIRRCCVSVVDGTDILFCHFVLFLFVIVGMLGNAIATAIAIVRATAATTESTTATDHATATEKGIAVACATATATATRQRLRLAVLFLHFTELFAGSLFYFLLRCLHKI